MSLDDLKSDLAANMEEFQRLVNNGPLTTTEDLVKHLGNTLWPFLANAVTELEEIDGTVEDLYTNADDVLQPDTAGQLAAVIVAATGFIMRDLKRRLDPNKPEDKKLLGAIREWALLAQAATETIAEITVQEDEEDDEPAEPGDEGEDDDDEDDEGEDDDDEDDAPPAAIVKEGK